ncbi:ubiquitin carboxyl-terminal hydrolase 2-like isoform X2 [Anopheles stephensi]|uniref:ubiquitin carboxyl-terminal hydrolase 2-like isoform X2 n=1 Tax=Anopheles stephensi TaxID=30069 RepID=UPI0016589800|nr:ubiquitin carboxyl-terminal hydrolase 2-like isoform X2 [Anopheles stephensi]XP_035912695.1 ubiquitin carboxyl-terminal hydrolase 2-like isoform X2 [Anopheles stephensi]
MPVISAYSSSGSRYIQPSTLTKSNYSDRLYYSPLQSSNKTCIISNGGLYRKSGYRFGNPFTQATSTSFNYRREERELSNSRTITKNKEATSDSRKTSVDTNNPNTNCFDTIKNNERRSSNNNRYSSTISNYATPTSIRSSGNYISNLRNTALSGAEIYQRYSISTFKPSVSVASRITQSSLAYAGSLPETTNTVKESSIVVSQADKYESIYNNKATIRLRPSSTPQSFTVTNGEGKSTNDYYYLEESVAVPKLPSSALVTAIVTTDDICVEDVQETNITANNENDLQVTATIRIKPKGRTSKHTNKEKGAEGVISSAENRSVMSDSNAIASTPISNRNIKRVNEEGLQEEKQRLHDSFHIHPTVDIKNDKFLNNGSSDHEAEKESLAVNGVSQATNDPIRSSTLNEDIGPEKDCNVDRAVNFRPSVELQKTTRPSRTYHEQTTAEKTAQPSSSRLSIIKSNNKRFTDAADSSRNGKEGLCGLWNIGNTCFMNSIIQCLSHTRELTSFLRSQSSTELGTNKDHRILAEYTKLIQNMWSGSQRTINPSDLKHAFSSKHRMYSGSAQQDAQEFLRFFLDSLHGALNVAVKRDPLGEIDDAMNRVKADMLWNWYSKAENSVIKDLFVGQLRSTLKCTHCDTESTMFDPFWDLSLPLPSSNSRCKLENCLEMFIKEEILDGIDQPSCSKCETRRKCTKSLTIERFPRYLVIHLKRFSETRWSKLTNTVEFPTKEKELNLQPYASEDIAGPIYYSLYGISNHIGSTAGGHYVALCKHPITQEWNEFNDNYVTETAERNLITSNAYVLFYERA